MFDFLKRFFDYNEKELDRIRGIVLKINELEEKSRTLKDEDFSKQTVSLKKNIQSGDKTLEEVLPWAFALVREASRRVLGERHFDTQLMAGIALHEGKATEQKTGEGKTLSATTALYLNALDGKGAHLVTVNDYLARRDCGWMGILFDFLGLTTSAIISDRSYIYDPSFIDKDSPDWRLQHLKPTERKAAYETDITYGINSEFGFDYLRDNMSHDMRSMVQRGFHYAIIDEADSVLIDEARTPHIISAPYDEDVSKYYTYAALVKRLDSKSDYVIDEKLKTANLTEAGIAKVESFLGVKNIYEKDFDTLFHIEASLKAETLFKVDKDYIVKDGEVIIVDEFTGRLLQGRRFSEGLHQAIEAKENVAIQKESKTLATVSLQNYFRMYKKLSGMTGTAATEAEELHKIYKMNTIVVPTHRPMVRKDEPDMIYKTEVAKFNAVVEEIIENYKQGRPILVGTTSIEKNEHLSQLLKKRGVPHEVLNAKNHEKEAHIIAQAGHKGAITVATNMAGRGVDIILGGSPPNRYELDGKKSGEKDYRNKQKEWQSQHDEIVKLGGLYVMGTERHESRRIDNQLRGRAGRQGDPGSSRFYVALEDDLMRIFGGEQISRLMTFFNFPEDQPLTHSMVSKAIEQAQVKVEGFNFDIRKHLVEFDDVLNKQRQIIYDLRRKILELAGEKNEELKETVIDIFEEQYNVLTNAHLASQELINENALEEFKRELQMVLPLDENKVQSLLRERNVALLVDYLTLESERIYNKRQKELGKELWAEIVRTIFLTTIDKYWMEHLTSIEELREGINLRGYAQMDPLVEYKNEAFTMFEKLIGDINYEVTRRLFKIEVSAVEPEEKKNEPLLLRSASGINPFSQKQEAKAQTASSQIITQTSPIAQTVNQQKPRKLGRNDPCWCGAVDPRTGKPYKYKKCGLINAPYHKV